MNSRNLRKAVIHMGSWLCANMNALDRKTQGLAVRTGQGRRRGNIGLGPYKAWFPAKLAAFRASA